MTSQEQSHTARTIRQDSHSAARETAGETAARPSRRGALQAARQLAPFFSSAGLAFLSHTTRSQPIFLISPTFNKRFRMRNTLRANKPFAWSPMYPSSSVRSS